MSHAEALPDWAEIHANELRHSIEAALDTVKADVSLRVPRTEAERQNAFAGWLAEQRVKYEAAMQSAVRSEFAALAEDSVGNIVTAYVWPEVEAFLRSFVLRYQAGVWVCKYMGDATTIGLPEPDGDYWRIPLGIAKYGENLGQIVLDADGNVILHLTSTRQQLSEKISDRVLPASTAASGQ